MNTELWLPKANLFAESNGVDAAISHRCGRLQEEILRGSLSLLLLAMGWFWIAGVAKAQNPVSLNILDARSAPGGNVQMVLTVVDEWGVPVKGLGKANFALAVEGEEVENFSIGPVSSAKTPLSVIVGIDVSGSMKGVPIQEAKRAAARFLDQLEKEDFTALMAFGSSVRFLTDFTRNKSDVREEIEKLAANEQHTWLYQATRDSLEKASRAPTSRVAVVLLTDGKDEGSPTTEQDVIWRLGGGQVPLYTLGFRDNAPVNYLKRIASISGGSFLFTPRPEDLPQLYNAVLEQLQNQYSVEFHFPQSSGEYKSEVSLSYQGMTVKAQKAFLHANYEPPPWWQEFPVHPATLVLVGFAIILGVVAVVRRPARAAGSSSSSSAGNEPHVSVMYQGEIHPIGSPSKNGNSAMTVMLQPTPGEVGLKIGLTPESFYFALKDSQHNKAYADVIITRYDSERTFSKGNTYLLLSHPTVHRPDQKTSGHARIFLDKATGRYQVEDLGSHLGTKLNDSVCNTVVPLEDGDTITLGGVPLAYYDKRANTGSSL